MLSLHEHLPTPNDLRTTVYVSKDGKLVRADPKLFPNALCLLHNCDRNRPDVQGQEGSGSSKGDHPAGPVGHDSDTAATTEASEYPIEEEDMDDGKPKRKIPKGGMVYNEWGELVDPEELKADPASKNMDVRGMLRLITLNWHYIHRRKLAEILNAQLEGASPFDDGPLTLSGRLMSWELKTIPKQNVGPENPPQAAFKVPVYDGPTRILDIGCDTGDWSFAVKKQHPDWIIDGVDDVNRWVAVHGEVIKDFMDGRGPPSKYFGNIHVTQDGPEFTLRCYDALLHHVKPIPRNLYGLIHGRDILAKVENYKVFLDDIRQILQPDGVVEFSEIDPRPRTANHGPSQVTDDPNDHTSRAITGFSSNIADRFKSPLDVELATDVPSWTARVDQRLQAALRPHDGIAAAQLKDWIAGAGFWDVKQAIIQLAVGGDTTRGRLMYEFLVSQISVENEVGKLAEKLPRVEIEALQSGKYYLNLHIVTGRKPIQPRPGDLLHDGTRQGMTDPYADMARYPVNKATHWERYTKFDISGSLAANNLGRFKLPVPNLRDRISSLKMHGMPAGSHNQVDGSMVDASSNTAATSGPSGSGLNTGPEIPWATRPNVTGYYGGGVGQSGPSAAQYDNIEIPYTQVGRFKVAAPLAGTRAAREANATQAATAEASTAEVTGTEVHIAEPAVAGAVIEPATTEPAPNNPTGTKGITNNVITSEVLDTESATDATGAGGVGNTKPVDTEVAITEAANSSDIASTEASNTEIVAGVTVPTELATTDVVSSGILAVEVGVTGVVATEASAGADLTGDVPSGLVIAHSVSPEVVSTGIVSAVSAEAVPTEDSTTDVTSHGTVTIEAPSTEATTIEDRKDGAATITTVIVEAEGRETEIVEAAASEPTTGEAATEEPITE